MSRGLGDVYKRQLDTLRALEGFLDDWPGALVVASHDRVFLDRSVDHVLAIDDAGRVSRVPGGVQGWLESRSVPPPRAERAKPSRPAPASNQPDRQASRYTLGRQIRETEQAMAKAQRRVDRLDEELANTVDHERLASLGADLAAAQNELGALEDRWLELSEQLPG